jgi:hypothetical protein
VLTEILTQLLRTPPFFGNFSANWEQTISLSSSDPSFTNMISKGLVAQIAWMPSRKRQIVRLPL